MKSYVITVNGNKYDVTVEETGTSAVVNNAPQAPVKPLAPAAPVSNRAEGSVKVSAPMPGKVLSIKANVGDAVKKGDVILVFEAMKMENSVVASQDGTIASIAVAVGDSFEAGATIATLK